MWVFFWNAILGTKDNEMSRTVRDLWIKESTKELLIPLIGIINPRIIITLGTKAFKGMKIVYNLKQKETLKDLILNNAIHVNGKMIFIFYNCGGLGLASSKQFYTNVL